eukprot:TRINITY_DN16243_c0_g1_i1.p1 TRINITY_DN16243_c0_g1~~TRINITY_DN16243_c0_g1_i1.p1  ORF type:complete len:521 (+),score=172.88 TRINITY_DN16243_c0_g1_i1:98-1564(+)
MFSAPLAAEKDSGGVCAARGGLRATAVVAASGLLGCAAGFSWAAQSVAASAPPPQPPPTPCPTPSAAAAAPPPRNATAAPSADVSAAEAAAAAAQAADPLNSKLLGHGGVVCTQRTSCDYFADVLVVVHLNPIRIDLWIDALLLYYGLFVPRLVFYSVLQPGARQGLDAEDVLYAGKLRTRVQLVDDRLGQSDYWDVAHAWRRWPRFAGYMLVHDDMLVNWWALADAARLPLAKVWRQEPEAKGAYNLDDPVLRRWNPGEPKGTHLARWKQVRRALDRFDAADVGKLRGKGMVAKVSGVWYVPAALMPKLARYAKVLWEEGCFIENATPCLLACVAEDGGYAPLSGRLDWGKRRYRYKAKFQFARQDFYHPVRASGELLTRLLDLARRRQVHADEDTEAFWESCFTCDEYPSQWWREKGRFHSCAAGCDSTAEAARPSISSGLVQIRRVSVLPPGELEHEGFWDAEWTRRIFARYTLINASGGGMATG